MSSFFNGLLDENYHLFTSNFHEGRLSKNDRDFLLTIRDFRTRDPKQILDNPSEVSKSMRPDDFASRYVLNVPLFDHLLSHKEEHKQQVIIAFKYISENFEKSEDFFTAYWAVGTEVDSFTAGLAENWPEYAASATKSPQACTHIAFLLKYVEPSYLTGKMNGDGILSRYLSDEGPMVFDSGNITEDIFSILERLQVHFRDLSSLSHHETLINFAHDHNLYQINVNNISYLLQLHCQEPDIVSKITTKNYSTICSIGAPSIKKYIEDNIELYINTVFIAMPSNTKEEVDAILSLLNNCELTLENKKQVILKQECVHLDLKDLPSALWSFVIEHEKVAFSFKMLSNYLEVDEVDKTAITGAFYKPHIISQLLSQHPNNIISKELATFIIENNDITDSTYHHIVQVLPYTWSNFPAGLSPLKRVSLADAGKIRLNENSYTSTVDDEMLLARLIASNIDAYFANKEGFGITDSVRENLLSLNLPYRHKLSICQDVSPDGVKSSSRLAQSIARVIISPEIDCSQLHYDVVSSAIAYAPTLHEALKIFLKCISMWDAEATMAVVKRLPPPYNDIAANGKRPKLPRTQLNTDLAKALEGKRLISSLSVTKDSIKINTFKS